jgi:hypothetical protein
MGGQNARTLKIIVEAFQTRAGKQAPKPPAKPAAKPAANPAAPAPC